MSPSVGDILYLCLPVSLPVTCDLLSTVLSGNTFSYLRSVLSQHDTEAGSVLNVTPAMLLSSRIWVCPCQVVTCSQLSALRFFQI